MSAPALFNLLQVSYLKKREKQNKLLQLKITHPQTVIWLCNLLPIQEST